MSVVGVSSQSLSTRYRGKELVRDDYGIWLVNCSPHWFSLDSVYLCYRSQIIEKKSKLGHMLAAEKQELEATRMAIRRREEEALLPSQGTHGLPVAACE